MSDYFNHEFASNSDLKKLVKMMEDGVVDEPENLSDIFDLGTLIHAILLEPHLADRTHKDYELAKEMAKTFMKDPLCHQLMFLHDFKREWEFYRYNVHGIKARCKMDGKSTSMSAILEYKGLACRSQKEFDEAIYRFNYDQGAAWYLDVTNYKHCLIVAVSKKDPRRIFKRLIDRDHLIYKIGEEKVVKAVTLWKEFFSEAA